MRLLKLTEQLEIRSGDRFEHIHIRIDPDIRYRGLGAGYLVAPQRADDVLFRNVTLEGPWVLPDEAPWYADMVQFMAGGDGIRFENVRVMGAPRIGLRVRGETNRLAFKDILAERTFTAVAAHEGPHRFLQIDGVCVRDGWIWPEKQPAYVQGDSELVPGRMQGWSAVNVYGANVARISGVSSWGEAAGFKVTHSRHVWATRFSVPNLMVQACDHVQVTDGTANRWLSSRDQRAFHPIQLSHRGSDVVVRNVRVQNDGRSAHAVQSAHGMQARIEDCQFFGWSAEDAFDVFDDISSLETIRTLTLPN